MINSLTKAMGIVCAIVTIHFTTPAIAAPLSLQPSAQSAAKAKVATLVAKPAGAKVARERRGPNRMPTWNTYTMGNADLAFLSAGQFLELSAIEDAIQVVSADELSPLDLVAGSVRFVSPEEVNEIDLANEPAVFIAQQASGPEARPVQEASAASATSEDPDADDGVLNRILMTFAGALAMAGAMRMFLA